MSTAPPNHLFSSIVSQIKTYTGDDPLIPWLAGVRKMRESLPAELLAEKLPRFLQKCAQTFESDRRYRNDLRFIRIWLELMDFVDDPRVILRAMELKRIGVRRSLFYQAYALYYEKMKKFHEADECYRLGVRNLAEPLDDLQKSYEKFLHRMEHYKSKIMKRMDKRASRKPLSDKSIAERISEDLSKVDARDTISSPEEGISVNEIKQQGCLKIKHSGARNLQKEDTAVIKFVDTAIIEGSEVEDACHHGLVDPTINIKEAMTEINNMFREPLEPAVDTRRQCKSQSVVSQKSNSGFEIFVDDNLERGVKHFEQEDGFPAQHLGQSNNMQKPVPQLQIFADDDGDSSEHQSSAEKSPSGLHDGGFPFLRPDDQQSESSNDANMEKTSKTKFRENTVVRRFVGSAILDDEPEVENICHHGLVDPTVNLKEAMDDINGMFGKPIDFVRMTRKKRLEATASLKKGSSGFSILPDDIMVEQGQNPASNEDYNNGFMILPDDDLASQHSQSSSSLKGNSDFSILPDDDLPTTSLGNGKERHDLYEETVFTKQAMDDINKMFAMPMDF